MSKPFYQLKSIIIQLFRVAALHLIIYFNEKFAAPFQLPNHFFVLQHNIIRFFFVRIIQLFR